LSLRKDRKKTIFEITPYLIPVSVNFYTKTTLHHNFFPLNTFNLIILNEKGLEVAEAILSEGLDPIELKAIEASIKKKRKIRF